MGTLVVKKYPTSLFAGQADHTYVECGTGGKGWSCWGGKTGGTEYRRGAGSTLRADVIAEPNERAGIKCYLVNGVCHQAANRILLPANITARGARGYDVSESMFGTYGRPRGPFGTCSSPFNQHAGVTGDVPQCAEPVPVAPPAVPVPGPISTDQRRREAAYLERVLSLYETLESIDRSPTGLMATSLETLYVDLFMLKVRYQLGNEIQYARLREIRQDTERSRMRLEESFARGELRSNEFMAAFNEETVRFQRNVAEILDDDQYAVLLGERRGDLVILADPQIFEEAYRGV